MLQCSIVWWNVGMELTGDIEFYQILGTIFYDEVNKYLFSKFCLCLNNNASKNNTCSL